MKKTLSAVLMAAVLCAGTALAAPVGKDGVIPYPKGQASNNEGAWSAPSEINHADSSYFTDLDVYKLESINGRRVVLPHYPSYQQTTEYTCGPAAALTVLYWYGNKDYDEPLLAKEMKTRPYPYGTGLKAMSNFFERIGWKVENSLGADKISRYDDFKNFVWYHHTSNKKRIAWQTSGKDPPKKHMIYFESERCDTGMISGNGDEVFLVPSGRGARDSVPSQSAP